MSDEVDDALAADPGAVRGARLILACGDLRMLRAAGMIGSGTEAEADQRVARERYRLIRTREWNDEIIERLRRKVR